MNEEKNGLTPDTSEAERLAEAIVEAASDVQAEAPAASAPEEPEEEKKKKPLLWLWILLALLVVAALIVGALFLFKKPAPEPEPESTVSTAPPTTTTTVKRVKNPVDFAALRKEYKNDDIMAWVKVPNTNVDYPVVQSSEDEAEDFYLHRDLDKAYDFAGTIYIQKLNNKDFTDPHTVLYGHSMLNGTMFKTLHYFQDKEFFDNNPEFTIYTPEHILTYKIFSAYKYDDRHLLYSFDTKNKAAFADYLKIAQHPDSDMVNTRPLPVSADDRIVTLSTCIRANQPFRYLVQGVLVKDELTYPTDVPTDTSADASN